MSTVPQPPVDAGKPAEPNAESEGLKAVLNAAEGKPLTRGEIVSGTDWFMSDDEEEQAWDHLDINVGGPVGSGREKWVRFKISALPREQITDIREGATLTGVNGVQKTNGIEANDQIAKEGLLEPNLTSGDPRLLKVRGQTFLDPVDALKARFAHKSGLIDIIANKIVELSGYADSDVREVKAAGN